MLVPQVASLPVPLELPVRLLDEVSVLEALMAWAPVVSADSD